MRDVREIDGKRGLRVRGQGTEWMGCLLDDLKAFGRRPVDDYSSGWGGMVQDGGTRDGTFHGEKSRAGLRHAIVCPPHTHSGSGKERRLLEICQGSTRY